MAPMPLNPAVSVFSLPPPPLLSRISQQEVGVELLAEAESWVMQGAIAPGAFSTLFVLPPSRPFWTDISMVQLASTCSCETKLQGVSPSPGWPPALHATAAQRLHTTSNR